MKLVLMGGKGMLASDVADMARAQGFEVFSLDLPDCDITRSEGLYEAIPACDAVINCAAFTRVDDAETERDLALAINATGAGHVAAACARRKLKLIHISTDYVFNGQKGSPYIESDPVEPLNFYGFSKLKGEQAVLSACPEAMIVRTQSLYGLRGRNFIKAILVQILQHKPFVKVVADQVSSPTYTRHLAAALLSLLPVAHAGIVNVACGGHCSWHAFACAVVERVRPGFPVHPVTTAEFKTPAQRPAFSVLDTSLYSQIVGQPLPTWQDGLEAYLLEEPLVGQVRGLA